jgi:hypothetical protein
VFKSTQTTSWACTLGTKVGTGNRASGTAGCDITAGTALTFRGNTKLYGCTVRQTANSGISITPATTGTCEIINCLFDSKATSFSAPLAFGNSATFIDNIYNLDVACSVSGQTIITNFFANNAERITVAASGSPTSFFLISASGFAIKDVSLFGTPTAGDFAWQTGISGPSTLVRPVWSGNASKFGPLSAPTSSMLTIGRQCSEYWMLDVKIEDGSGTAISGIPVRLTDTVGTVQVNTTSNSSGEISFGSGLTAEAVIVMDHYAGNDSAADTVYRQRHRSPFLLEVNLPTMAGYNNNYQSKRMTFNWPGYESVTTSAGTFEDVNIVISLSDPPGTPTIWTEASL